MKRSAKSPMMELWPMPKMQPRNFGMLYSSRLIDALKDAKKGVKRARKSLMESVATQYILRNREPSWELQHLFNLLAAEMILNGKSPRIGAGRIHGSLTNTKLVDEYLELMCHGFKAKDAVEIVASITPTDERNVYKRIRQHKTALGISTTAELIQRYQERKDFSVRVNASGIWDRLREQVPYTPDVELITLEEAIRRAIDEHGFTQ